MDVRDLGDGAAPEDSDRPSRASRRLPYVVFGLLASAAILTSLVVNGVVQDQERRLLDQQARAAGEVVSTSFTGLTSTLPLLGALAQPGVGGPELFDAVASRSVQDGGAVGTATRTGDGFVVQNAVGDGPAEQTRLTGVRAQLTERAAGADGLVSQVQNVDGMRRLLVAIATPTSRDVVVYAEVAFDPADLTQSTDDGPFSELEGAIYVGRTTASEDLLFATAPMPLSDGPTVSRTVAVGADHWLVVVTPKDALVGGFAARLPWMVLALGLLAALLVGVLLASISRRRTYALRLVDERTAELRAALVEQERLEEGQRLAREAAEEANQAKSEFLSRMSHELRTPLNAVLGFAQLLEVEDLDEDSKDSVQQILRGGRHLLDLINEVLDITRIETGRFQLSSEPVLADDVLDEVLQLTAPLAEREDVHLVRGAANPAVTHVLADQQRLKQILLNLIGNAIKYNRSGGTVVVSSERVEPNRLRIKVCDTGPGIRPEDRALLFTLFERLGAEQTNVEGTGVGLALSRRLAEAMGGTVDVDSTFGQGSTFWVELPIVESPVQRFERFNGPQEPAVRDIPPPAEHRSKVLYIEDNLLNLRLVKRILDDHPSIELITATQGRLGIEIARAHQPKLVLLDLHLSDIHGDEVLRRLHDDPETSSIPVVVVSADATAGQIRRLLAEGASSYLTKPLDVRALRDLLDGVPTGVSIATSEVRVAPDPAPDADSAIRDAVVLVVDDHEPNLVLLERTLTRAGITHVHTTGDPASVVSLYRRLRPHLVILDLHMPGMDGVAVMQALEDATAPDEYLPVIVLTADATTQARDRVLAAGANDFLTKPVDRTEVVLRVRNLLHSRALHTRLQEHNARLQEEIAQRREAEDRARSAMVDKARRIEEVLDEGPPRIVFQPITDLSSAAIVGYEALSRFDFEPQRPPDHWFAEAAEVGRGVTLELAAAGAALTQLRCLPSDTFLTLNISPAAACTQAFAALIAGHPGRRLVLEITEHVRVDDYAQLLDALGRLRRAGVRLAVDDAGAGFASLHHILRIRPDVIKLDTALTRDVDTDPVKRALASSLVTFSRDIGAVLIAEGIETSSELLTLVELGVPWGQGYHLGYPDRLPSRPGAAGRT